MIDTEKVGLLDGVPIEILDAYERRAKDVAALWGDASAGARQAVLVSMLRAWHSGRKFLVLPSADAMSIMLANSNTVCSDMGFDEIDKISKAVVAHLCGGAKE